MFPSHKILVVIRAATVWDDPLLSDRLARVRRTTRKQEGTHPKGPQQCSMLRLAAFALLAACAGAATPAQRAAAMLAQMNITEKIAMVHGMRGPYVVRSSPLRWICCSLSWEPLAALILKYAFCAL